MSCRAHHDPTCFWRSIAVATPNGQSSLLLGLKVQNDVAATVLPPAFIAEMVLPQRFSSPCPETCISNFLGATRSGPSGVEFKFMVKGFGASTGVQAFFDVQAYNKPTNLLDDLQAKLSNDSVIDGESVDGLGNVQGVTLALGYEAGEGCVHASG